VYAAIDADGSASAYIRKDAVRGGGALITRARAAELDERRAADADRRRAAADNRARNVKELLTLMLSRAAFTMALTGNQSKQLTAKDIVRACMPARFADGRMVGKCNAALIDFLNAIGEIKRRERLPHSLKTLLNETDKHARALINAGLPTRDADGRRATNGHNKLKMSAFVQHMKEALRRAIKTLDYLRWRRVQAALARALTFKVFIDSADRRAVYSGVDGRAPPGVVL